jgi:hypothetical protein
MSRGNLAVGGTLDAAHQWLAADSGPAAATEAEGPLHEMDSAALRPLLVLTHLVLPLTGMAQDPGKVARIGLLGPVSHCARGCVELSEPEPCDLGGRRRTRARTSRLRKNPSFDVGSW